MAWVRPVGELDIATAPEVEERLEKARSDGHDEIILDLRGTSFIDSVAITTVVTWHQRAAHDDFSFAVVDGQTHVRQVFEISGVNKIARFVDGD